MDNPSWASGVHLGQVSLALPQTVIGSADTPEKQQRHRACWIGSWTLTTARLEGVSVR